MIKNRTAFSAFLYKNGIRVMTTSAANPRIIDEIRTTITRKSPGLNSPKKLWWAKQVTGDYFVAGRLSRRQLQYASEGGFKSIISLFTYKNHKDCCLGDGYLPSTTEMASYAKEAGLEFRTVMDTSNNSSSVDSVLKLGQSLKNIPTPALLFSDRGYSATYALFMFLLKTKGFSMDQAVLMSGVLGMDLSMKCINQKLCKEAGENLDFPKLNALPKNWLEYWPAIPVYKNWFVAGQILESHIPLIKKAGFKSVVNLRAGITHNGKPSQEKVNLLNIKDGDAKQNLTRQGMIDPSGSNPSQNSVISNPEEFGDSIGYNEEIERTAFRKAGFPYYHLPVVNSEPYSAELFTLYEPELMDAVNRGPVLVHCASSKRAGYVAVLAAAVQNQQDLTWALARLSELGLAIGPNKKPDIYEMYTKTLSKDWKNKYHQYNSQRKCKLCSNN